MKKIKLLLLLLFLINNTIFAITWEEIDAPFDFLLGNDVSEIIKNLGHPVILETLNEETIYGTNIRWRFMFYDNMRISLQYIYNDPNIYVSIYSPKLTILNGIHVGMDFSEVEKRLGEPAISGELGNIYFGRFFMLIFEVNNFNQVTLIDWEVMGV